MSMVSQDKRKKAPFWNSFSHAIAGIVTAVKNERNMRFHLYSSIVVIVLSIYFSISRIEWMFVLLLIGGMFALELVNTAVERVVDMVTQEYHPLAKQAKDVAAGAVFVYAILSICVGIFIFFPYFQRFITNL